MSFRDSVGESRFENRRWLERLSLSNTERMKLAHQAEIARLDRLFLDHRGEALVKRIVVANDAIKQLAGNIHRALLECPSAVTRMVKTELADPLDRLLDIVFRWRQRSHANKAVAVVRR